MSSFRRLLQYVTSYRLNVILNIACNFLYVIFSTLSIALLWPFLKILFSRTERVGEQPIFAWNKEAVLGQLKYQLSHFIEMNGQLKALTLVCGLVITVFFFKNLFRYFAMLAMASVRTGVVRDVRKSLYDKVLQLPLSYFSEKKKGDIISRMTADVQEIQWSVLNMLEVVFREPLMIVFSLIIMLFISPKLTLFVFLLLIFTSLIIGRLGKSLKKQASWAQELFGGILSIMDETLGGLRVIKGFNATEYESVKFDRENEAYRDTMTRILWRRDLSSPLSEFLGVSVFVVLLWLGAQIVFDQKMEAAEFMVYLGIFYQIINPAKAFSTAYYNIQKGIAATIRVEKILDAPIDIEEVPQPISLQKFDNQIVFKDVFFHYDDNKTVLKNINFSIPKGKVIALVGPSGGGKSTIADLLPRFYDVQKGEILLDGTNVKDFRIKELRSLMGIVSQEAILFNDTIMNNILFGLKGISKEEVEKAAQIANAHDFILQTEKGYETVIGDRGNKLSGGQKQRITIARAILRDPAILILDEATSALDSESEQLVQEALYKIMQNRTSLVIAHRLSTVQHADEIIVLEDGRIIEQGSHNSLMKKQGAYHKLVNLQAL